MHLVFDDGEREWELTVDVRRPDATVADLINALVPGRGPGVALRLGSRLIPPDNELGEVGLQDGDVLSVVTGSGVSPGGSRRRSERMTLDVVGGLDAGRHHRLVADRFIVGRDRACDVVLADPTVSRRHAAFVVSDAGTVTVTDLKSTNGTWRADVALTDDVVVGPTDVIRMGAVHVVARPISKDERAYRGPRIGLGLTGVTPFNRPPRAAAPPAPPAIDLPEPPKVMLGPGPFGVVAVVGPLAVAAVLVIAMGNPVFALFAALSPVVLIGSHVENRRRASRASGRETARHREAVRRLCADLDDALALEARRRASVLPDLAEVHRRAVEPSVHLWKRRPGDEDWLLHRAGLATVNWQPTLRERGQARTAEVQEALVAHCELRDAPVEIDLSDGGVVGIVGPRWPALALARSIVAQAAVHHGPADLAIAVLAPDAAGRDWDWAKWLPHTRSPDGGGRLLAAGEQTSLALAQRLLTARDVPYTVLLVVDGEHLMAGRGAPLRALLGGRGGAVAGVVLAPTVDQLPSVCRTVVELHGADGDASAWWPHDGDERQPLLVGGLAADVARQISRGLARYDDPELDVPGSGLPDTVRLLPLLVLDAGALVDGLAARWAAAGSDPAPRTPIGLTLDGVCDVDLARDGPHVLIAGTTGAGKSELLRTLVAGLAASASPDHITFLLIDFKGGSAFDACARLPHAVGLLTDLDEDIAARALRCLEAELRHRERLLRVHGAVDLPAYRAAAADGRAPLPRLVVLVDEFATLKAELPDFVDALVGVAQRGRSLGVHLVLATQRPAGAVSDNVRANTNLRIALRVQDAADSLDVVGVASAAALPRHRPGRAVVRFGPAELTPIQTAVSTAATVDDASAPVVVSPFTFGSAPNEIDASIPTGPSELDLLVDAAGVAHQASGRPLPRPPCPAPLADDIDLAALLSTSTSGDAGVPFALADDPDRQRSSVHSWRMDEGNLLLWGIGGSGTSTALVSIAIALAKTRSPDEVHLYGIAAAGSELGALAALPHCGAVAGPGERERQARLLRVVRRELAQRQRARAAGASGMVQRPPAIVLLVDGYAAFAAEHADVAGITVTDDLSRIFADGPEVGIHAVITADRISAIPHALAALATQRLLFRLADPHDYAMAGVAPGAVPRSFCAGRAVDVASGLVVQVARVQESVADAVGAIAECSTSSARAPLRVGAMPSHVARSTIGFARLDARPWTIPLGIGERDLLPVGFTLYAGEHALIAGPGRSGRSTTLGAVAAAVRQCRAALTVVVAGPRSPVRSTCAPDEVADAVAAVLAHRGPAFVLVDDAELLDDATGVMARLLDGHHPHVAVIAAGRAESLRTAYTHWTRGLRRSKTGLLLQPHVDLDGELLGVTLPRRAPVALGPGRGWLVGGGDLEVCQVAVDG